MSPEFNIEVVPMADVPLDKAANLTKERLVLVVDDERVIADTLSVILARSGFSVLTAYEAETALKLAIERRPDLLLSDVMMGPGMDGTELAIRMVQTMPDCKVLLFSGHAATVDLLAQARRRGHEFTVLTKPVHPADLLAKITESFAPPAMAL